MLKKIFVLLILLVAFSAQAQTQTVVVVGQGTAAVGDSCTGALLLSSHFENSDDVTVGGGCSAGADSTWALTNATYTDQNPQSGTYSLLLDANTDTAVITVTSDDIISDDAGRVDFYYYMDTTADGDLFRAAYDNSNNIRINIVNQEITLAYRGNTDTVSISTTACDMAAGNSYHIIARWRQGATDPSLSITCGADTVTSNDNLTNFAAGIVDIKLGDNGGWTGRGKVDTLKIYNAYE